MDKQRNVYFHLDQDVLPIDDLQACVSEFSEMVKSASEDCMANVKWLAEIQKGSVALSLYPVSETETDEEIDQFLGVMREEFKVIRGGKAPETFSDKTLGHYSKLAKIFSSAGPAGKKPTICVYAPSIPDETPIEMVDYQPAAGRSQCSKAFGTAYGQVKSLSATGTPYFALYDDETKRRVKVFYDDALLDSVRESYRNEVRVTGEITYNEDGTKKQIVASELEVLSSNGSVSLSDLFGILGDAE